MTSILQQDIQYLPGVGPNRRKMLSEELDIHTFGDLLQYYPYKHVASVSSMATCPSYK